MPITTKRPPSDPRRLKTINIWLNILEKKEDSKLLFEAIDSLNNEQKTAYILKNIQGLSYKKISVIMKKSTSSIESLIFRSKKNLKKYLKKNWMTRNNYF